MLNLFHNDSMGMLSRQRMIENDSDGVLIRNLVNKLILIKKKIKWFKDFQFSLHLFPIFQLLCRLESYKKRWGFVTEIINLRNKSYVDFLCYCRVHQRQGLLQVVLADRDPNERGPTGQFQNVIPPHLFHIYHCQGSPAYIKLVLSFSLRHFHLESWEVCS